MNYLTPQEGYKIEIDNFFQQCRENNMKYKKGCITNFHNNFLYLVNYIDSINDSSQKYAVQIYVGIYHYNKEIFITCTKTLAIKTGFSVSYINSTLFTLGYVKADKQTQKDIVCRTFKEPQIQRLWTVRINKQRAQTPEAVTPTEEDDLYNMDLFDEFI